MTVRFVQVGTGFWGASWAPLLRGRADVELVALVDIDPAASARVASEIGLGDDRCFTTVGDALAAGLDLDAALVVVQPEHHEAVTVPALRAGLHCLVEKPIAHTVASARAIVDEGRRANRVVMVSQNYHFARAPRTVQRLIAGGAIGTVEQVQEQLSREVYEFPRLQLRRAASLFDYTFEDMEIVGYRHHPALRAPVAV